MAKYVYRFKDCNKNMRDILGNKGANLGQMYNSGFPVPDGVVVSTKTCLSFFDSGEIPKKAKKELKKAIEKLKKRNQPLVVSVRSGASVSMPGILSTILNVGINDVTVKQLGEKYTPEFAYDCYKRLVKMFAIIVMGVDCYKFDIVDEEVVLDDKWSDYKYHLECYKEIYKQETGKKFPQDVFKQVEMATIAVFHSWNSKKALVYRKKNNIPQEIGTAVTIQKMVFGNLNDKSCTGVVFTHNPQNGNNEMFGEYLPFAQGEDIVSGHFSALPIENLENVIPSAYKQLASVCKKLEASFLDMQDVEFTIEDGVLYILQTRVGKRTEVADMKIKTDMAKSGLISRKAIPRKTIDYDEKVLDGLELIFSGKPVSGQIIYGKVCFEPKDVGHTKKGKQKPILILSSQWIDAFEAVYKCGGIITINGGVTSHPSVIAREIGIACVVDCKGIKIIDKSFITDKGILVHNGEYITINGFTGDIYLGKPKSGDENV